MSRATIGDAEALIAASVSVDRLVAAHSELVSEWPAEAGRATVRLRAQTARCSQAAMASNIDGKENLQSELQLLVIAAAKTAASVAGMPHDHRATRRFVLRILRVAMDDLEHGATVGGSLGERDLGSVARDLSALSEQIVRECRAPRTPTGNADPMRERLAGLLVVFGVGALQGLAGSVVRAG